MNCTTKILPLSTICYNLPPNSLQTSPSFVKVHWATLKCVIFYSVHWPPMDLSANLHGAAGYTLISRSMNLMLSKWSDHRFCIVLITEGCVCVHRRCQPNDQLVFASSLLSCVCVHRLCQPNEQLVFASSLLSCVCVHRLCQPNDQLIFASSLRSCGCVHRLCQPNDQLVFASSLLSCVCVHRLCQPNDQLVFASSLLSTQY